jgi:hydroxyethylthiazole kinase-like sugar kinase family protein
LAKALEEVIEMNDRTEEGVGWAVITLLCSLGAAVASSPLLKLVTAIAAVEAGVKAVECFQSAADAAYQRLTNPQEYHRLSPGA